MKLLPYIEQNSRIVADQTAISYRIQNEWKSITWKEFWQQIVRTANGLRSIGIQKGDCAGIFSQNSKDWLMMDIAIQSLGAITVPIYATNNFEQTEYIIHQTEMKSILVGDENQLEIVQKIKEKSGKNLTVFTSFSSDNTTEENFEINQWNQQFSAEYQPVNILDDDLATILYTSGTTGMPKGVMLSHGGFAEVFQTHKKYFNIENFHGKKSLAFLPLSHIFERAWSLFFLSQGGEVAVLDQPKDVLEALKAVKPYAMCSVPRFYEKVYQTLLKKIEMASSTKQKLFNTAISVGKRVSEHQRKEEAVPFFLQLKYKLFNSLIFKKIKNEFGGNLAFLPVGGAALKKEISEFFSAINMPVIVGYGLTETSATVTAYPFKNFIHGSVGKILPGVDLKIGADDEILIKYGGVMKGYYKNEEETAKVFTPDGYFRTGDAGKLDEEGNLYITDRIKDLMKTSNGKYIAPQIIEIPLQTHPDILQIMIVAEGRTFVSALIVPDFESLAMEFNDFKNYMNLSLEEKKALLEQDKIKDKYKKIIQTTQKDFADFEKIKKFKLLPEEFTIDKGEITPTLKIKRKVVTQKFENMIEEMYD